MNKGNVVRWVIVGIMLVFIATMISSPALAETPVLSMDFTQGGTVPKADGWTYDDSGNEIGYTDSTIEMTLERGNLTLTVKGKKVKHETVVIRVKIQDVSQLRTAVSKDTYKGRGQAKGLDMAKSKNAVVAMNGDFFKYEYDVGYVVRQGEFIRDATANKRKRIFDMLLIDSKGNFHTIDQADTKKIEAYVSDALETEGLSILDTFNLGPVLIKDGEVQDISQSEVAREGLYQWKYPQQRICIAQTGELEYAIVEVFGRTDSSAGISLQDFAEFVHEQVPDAITAYNLDGGGSTNLVVNNKRACSTPGLREITDIIYFASAEE
ncbi:MAG: phosphodiester glycosidase family protein [Clostridia bacterium]|nr:phosphodiester glycosidase family protein [Clostridia bacterium]